MAEKKADEKVEEAPLTTPQGIEELPTLYVDAFFLTYWPEMTKMAFGEHVDDTVRWRASVIMSQENIEILVDRLKEVLDEFRGAEDAKK